VALALVLVLAGCGGGSQILPPGAAVWRRALPSQGRRAPRAAPHLQPRAPRRHPAAQRGAPATTPTTPPHCPTPAPAPPPPTPQVTVLRAFKARFRSAAATLLASADADSFQAGLEGLHYEGPLALEVGGAGAGAGWGWSGGWARVAAGLVGALQRARCWILGPRLPDRAPRRPAAPARSAGAGDGATVAARAPSHPAPDLPLARP
jgi:hypothetical protein